jgi:hypothetical protein
MNCLGLRSHPSFAYSAASDADRIPSTALTRLSLSNLVAAGLTSSSRRKRQDFEGSLDRFDERQCLFE